VTKTRRAQEETGKVAAELGPWLALLDEAYDHRSWHGTNLRGSIRGLSPAQAVWRPGPGRHNVEEIVVHAAYWKYAVWRRITGHKRGSFALKGSNWFPRKAAAARDWRADLALLANQHRALREAVTRLRSDDLVRRSGGRPLVWYIRGAAAHDLYHAGQIQALKRLCPIPRRSGAR
jgi:hypothetical protein